MSNDTALLEGLRHGESGVVGAVLAFLVEVETLVALPKLCWYGSGKCSERRRLEGSETRVRTS